MKTFHNTFGHKVQTVNSAIHFDKIKTTSLSVIKNHDMILKVSNQKGISLQYNRVKIYHSGWKPSIWKGREEEYLEKKLSTPPPPPPPSSSPTTNPSKCHIPKPKYLHHDQDSLTVNPSTGDQHLAKRKENMLTSTPHVAPLQSYAYPCMFSYQWSKEKFLVANRAAAQSGNQGEERDQGEDDKTT